MSDVCVQATITGKVQGVGFRAATRDQAVPRGITGYVKNLSNGSVQVKACGDEEAVNKLVQWLHQGPPAAQVKDVKLEEVTLEMPRQFSIR